MPVVISSKASNNRPVSGETYNSVNLSDWAEKNTVVRMQQMSRPILMRMKDSPLTGSLIDKVLENPFKTIASSLQVVDTYLASVEQDPEIQNEIAEIRTNTMNPLIDKTIDTSIAPHIPEVLSEFEKMDTQLEVVQAKTTNPVTLNCIVRIRIMIAEMMAQFNRSEVSYREKIESLKQGIKESTLTGADLQKDVGWNGLKFAIISLAFMGAAAKIPEAWKITQALVSSFGKDVIPAAGNLWGSGMQAQQQILNGKVGVDQSVLSAELNGKQLRSNQLDEFKQTIRSVNDDLRKAAGSQ
jgi:hypothetical protein